MPYINPAENARCKKEYQSKWQKWWEHYKENTPCLDCRNHFKHWQMEFDHVRGVKTKNMASFKNADPLSLKAQEELAKCDLVCVLCHADRTYYRRIFQAQVHS